MSTAKSNSAVPASELSVSFARSSGAGGQNVNKVATKAIVRWHLGSSRAFSAETKEYLRRRLAPRLTAGDELVVSSEAERSQSRNRAIAVARLNDLVRRALIKPKIRRPTRPTPASRKRRLEAKIRRSFLKQARKKVEEGRP